MFTGLIETVGEVAEVKVVPGGIRLRVVSELANSLRVGESVAVNGVCLTVILTDPTEVHVDVSPETARVTTLGAITRGRLVNLERPLPADGRLGGHFVQGHVDGTGVVEDVRPEGEFYWLTISYPGKLAPLIVRKGSIAVDGISLTVAGLGEDRFDVQIIPHTWANTNLRHVQPREAVNLECDIIGKYVVRALEVTTAGSVARNRVL